MSDIYVSASGAIARLHDLDVVANNLANVDTTGFRRDLTIFEVAVQSALRDVDRETVPGSPGSAMTGISASTSDYGSGPITQTGKPLDVAILGPGWFEVETPDGLRYTRAGAFAVDPEQRIVTPDGHPVLGPGGPLQAGAGIPELLASGDLVDSTGASLGRLKLVDFERVGLLVKDGHNFYRALDGAGPIDIEPQLAARSIERSNVSAVSEMSRLVILQRAFDASMQILQQQDRSTERLLREIGS
jgi:flagellar basal body rod protein FlgG